MKIMLQVDETADKIQAKSLRELLPASDPDEAEQHKQDYSHVLRLDVDGLSLARLHAEKRASAAAPTRVDFLAEDLTYRRKTTGKSSAIGKAVGLRKIPSPNVLDVTAGLGRDAFILASLGCQVTMLERSGLIHALLEDGLRRARAEQDAEVDAILDRMQLHQTNASAWLNAILVGERPRPDVIYLDPMFPERGKHAKVKKDIKLLQEVLGVDEDYGEVLTLARRCAKRRVVVKRPGKAARSGQTAADYQVPGKSSHFEIYLPVNSPERSGLAAAGE